MACEKISTAEHSISKRTLKVRLGEVDAFLSHSWSDDAALKWTKLQEWRAAFKQRKEREPIVWFDRACVDQQNITESLKALPVYLAGCNQMLVFWGATYATRLWCIIELFTVFRMTGSLYSVQIVPLAPSAVTEDDPRATATQRSSTGGSVRFSSGGGTSAQFPSIPSPMGLVRSLTRTSFTWGSVRPEEPGMHNLASVKVRYAKCFLPEDRQKMFAIIESSFGDLESFDETLRDVYRKNAKCSFEAAATLAPPSPSTHSSGRPSQAGSKRVSSRTREHHTRGADDNPCLSCTSSTDVSTVSAAAEGEGDPTAQHVVDVLQVEVRAE